MYGNKHHIILIHNHAKRLVKNWFEAGVNVVGVPNDAVKVGDSLEVVFDAVTPEITLPRFRLAGQASE